MSDTAAVFHHADAGTPEAEWSRRPEWASLACRWRDAEPTPRDSCSWPPTPTTRPSGRGVCSRPPAAGLRATSCCSPRARGRTRAPRTHSRADLAALRVEETRAALSLLAPHARLRLGRPARRGPRTPTRTRSSRPSCARSARRVHDPHRRNVAPRRHSRSRGRRAGGAVAAHRTDARLIEYPIWLWHWAAPTDAPWQRFRTLALAGRCVHASHTQSRCIAARSRHSPTIPATRPCCTRASSSTSCATARPSSRSHPRPTGSSTGCTTTAADPWSVDDSWYEERKRDLTLAALPRRRFRRALEVGCSIGALTARLAERCDEVLALDESEVAVAAAARRLAQHAERARRAGPSCPTSLARRPFRPRRRVGGRLLPQPRPPARPHGARRGRASPTTGSSCSATGASPIVGWPLDGPRVHEIWHRHAASRSLPSTARPTSSSTCSVTSRTTARARRDGASAGRRDASGLRRLADHTSCVR